MASTANKVAHSNRIRVLGLYKKALKNAVNWAEWQKSAYDELKSMVRSEVEKHRHEYDPHRIEQLISVFEKMNATFTHGNPYTPPEGPGGTKEGRFAPLPPHIVNHGFKYVHTYLKNRGGGEMGYPGSPYNYPHLVEKKWTYKLGQMFRSFFGQSTKV